MDYFTSGSATKEDRASELKYLIEVQETIIERAERELQDLYNEVNEAWEIKLQGMTKKEREIHEALTEYYQRAQADFKDW